MLPLLLRFVVYVVVLLSFPSVDLSDGASSSAASLSLASYYTDHMVLQMEPQSAVIWGYSEAGAVITVSFKGKVYTSVATPVVYSTIPVWRVTLDPTPPSGPFNIVIISVVKGQPAEQIILKDVLFGDIWLCSGQSNMAFTVPNVFNASQVLNDSYKYPNIRLLAVNEVNSSTPFYDLNSLYEPWSLPSPKTLGVNNSNDFYYFSAVCYLFGVELYEHLGYPIGLISDNWGGTPVQAWSSPDVLKSCPESRIKTPKEVVNTSKPMDILEKIEMGGPGEDSVLWNAMIHPMLNFTIKGVIWYQGEANHDDSERYSCLFPAMIKDWRKKWYEGTRGKTDPSFPFGFVQIGLSDAPFNDTTFPLIRFAQTAYYGYVPNPKMRNVFMAVSVDLPDPDSPFHAIHPRDKQDVAHRLALGARNLAYDEPYTSFRGPYPSDVCGIMENKISVEYTFSDIKLLSGDLFEVCCSDKDTCHQQEEVWQSVDLINQVNATSLTLGYQCKTGTTATYLRYIWKDNPCQFKNCAVYGAKNDLPAAPFFEPVQNC